MRILKFFLFIIGMCFLTYTVVSSDVNIVFYLISIATLVAWIIWSFKQLNNNQGKK